MHEHLQLKKLIKQKKNKTRSTQVLQQEIRNPGISFLGLMRTVSDLSFKPVNCIMPYLIILLSNAEQFYIPIHPVNLLSDNRLQFALLYNVITVSNARQFYLSMGEY